MGLEFIRLRQLKVSDIFRIGGVRYEVTETNSLNISCMRVQKVSTAKTGPYPIRKVLTELDIRFGSMESGGYRADSIRTTNDMIASLIVQKEVGTGDAFPKSSPVGKADSCSTNQASLDASLAAKKAEKEIQKVKAKQEAIVAKVNEQAAIKDRKIQELEAKISRQNQEINAIKRVNEEQVKKVEQIQIKAKAEEIKVGNQEKLNQKLAVQAQLNQKLKNKGENKPMKKLLGNAFNFGKVEGKFAFSPVTNGLALRKGISNDFVAYDKDSKSLTDVSGLTLKFDVPAFKLPVSHDKVEVGDIIIHNAEFLYVTKIADGYIQAINPEKAVNASIIPTKNALLGAAFYTVVKTLDAAGGSGFNPMLLMALNKDGDSKDLLPLLLATGGFGGAAGAEAGQIDPMLFALLGDDTEDLLPLVLMQQGGATGAGFNPIFFLLANKKDGSSKDLLPFLLMQQGAAGAAQGTAGAINPLMFLAMGDGDIDPMTLMALSGGFGGQAGGIFGQAPAKTEE